MNNNRNRMLNELYLAIDKEDTYDTVDVAPEHIYVTQGEGVDCTITVDEDERYRLHFSALGVNADDVEETDTVYVDTVEEVLNEMEYTGWHVSDWQ